MIVDLESKAASLAAFLDLPRRVYAADPWYCAARADAVRKSLERPAFRGRQRALLALDGGQARARVVARLSPTLRDERGLPVGMIGFFEAEQGAEQAGDALREAVRWLRERGAGEIVGPMDGDTWHRYRFNVGPFDEPPFLMEPYNPPHYAPTWERAGFAPLERYYSQRIDDLPGSLAHFEAARRGAHDAGFTFRPIDRRRLRAELALLHDLSTKIFQDNFLYEPIGLEDFLELYEGIEPLLDEQLVWFAHAQSGEPVGFVFALADHHAAVAAMRGESSALAQLRFVWHKRDATAVNVKTVGILPAQRRFGLAGALFERVYTRAIARGLTLANHCLIKDDNPSGHLDAGHGKLLRRYVLYRFAGA